MGIVAERLRIANVAPGVRDEDVVAFVKRYSGLEGKVARHVEVDGGRPAIIVQFADVPRETVEKLALRFEGMYWNGRALSASRIPKF